MAFVIILSGCSNKSTPEDKMYDILENTAAKENIFEDQQKPLMKLEKQEKATYDQIIKLGMKKYDEIVKLSDQAIASADKRKKLLNTETKSIKESKTEFQKTAEVRKQLKDPAQKKLANDLYEIMMKRYSAHDKLFREYTAAIKIDKKMYEMFKDKNLALEDLEDQVTKLNEAYEKVNAANKEFNTYTEQYNSKKLEFYKKVGLK